jgi:hypothetical protein
MLILLLTGFAVTAATFAFAMQYGAATAVMAGMVCGAIATSVAAIWLHFAAQRGKHPHAIRASDRQRQTRGGLFGGLEKRLPDRR